MIFKSKYDKIYSLIEQNRLDEAYSLTKNLLNKNLLDPNIYLILAEICFKKNNFAECKEILLKLLLLPNWYKEKIVRKILELTNWKMLVPNNYFCKEPQFSSDGEKIVFCCATEDTNNDGKITNDDCAGIYIVDKNGQEIKEVVPNKYYNSLPCFSPDGEYICFLSARRDTNGDGKIDSKDAQGLYLLNLKTGQEQLLIEDIYRPKHPSFSPDGKKIIFSCWQKPDPTAKSGIYMINLSNWTIVNLVVEKYESVFPLFSPNGEYIVYSSFCASEEFYGGPQQKCGIFIKELATNNVIPVASPEYINSFPVISHDSKKIAFLSKRRDTNNDGVINSLDNDGIYIFDIKKKKEYCAHSDEYYNKYINFTYDDKYIVFLSTSHKKEKQRYKEYFEYKGVYMKKLLRGKCMEIVSPRFYGSQSPNVSPTSYEVVYTSFRKNTLRGLYLAYLNKIPTKEEIKWIINKNL